MALYSAGVEIKEIDQTNVVPATATSIGGFAGSFNWGPAGQLVTVSSEKDLVTAFGAPNSVTLSTTASFFTAASFLKYGNSLKVSRSVETGDLNAATKPWTATGSIATLTAAPSAPGDLYAVGDILTIATGTAGNLATAKVLTISGGGATGPVATVSLLYSGAGYSVGTGKATTGGSGNGACTLAVGAIFADSYGTYTATQIANEDVFNATVSGIVLKSAIVGRYPGALGNSLKVVLCRASALAGVTGSDGTQRDDVSDLFSYAPNRSSYATQVRAANPTNSALQSAEMNDEIHIAVIDSDGSFTGTAGTILEKYEGLSLFTDAKTENGATNYYRSVINNNSSYIYINKLMFTRNVAVAGSASLLTETEFAITDVTALSCASTPLAARKATGGVTITLAGGTNVAMAAAGMNDAYNMFADSQSIDVSLLFGEVHNVAATAATNDGYLKTIVDVRKDCIGFMSAPLSVAAATSDSDKKTLVVNKANSAPASSYMVMDSGPVYVYNKYQDQYLYIPACGHIAGLCANTDLVADTWFSPAGFNRGQLRDVVKLAYNPNQADRDAIYKLGVNPVCSFPGQGIVLFGDKTRLAKPSAFDRINVRRLFIALEKSIATASKFQLFEQNDDFTRAAFKNIVEPFLRDVQGRRGIVDFRVVCDSTNNTGEVVDANRFVADIYIKPTRSINFITLNFIATRSGVEFRTIVG